MVDWLRSYLDRLGLEHPGPPSAQVLFAVHRAHVERVAYENIDIQLGRPAGISPAISIRQILAGRGGYCFSLNGAFATLLAALGFHVTWHRGCVHGASENPRPEQYGNHLALTVSVDGTVFMVDAGLGNAHYEPMPLTAGEHRQGSFTFRLEKVAHGAGIPAGWRFIQDPALRSFYAMDFTLAPATLADFLPHHAELSTSPSSLFVRLCQLYRRDAAGIDFVHGCVLGRDNGNGDRSSRELTSLTEWLDAAADVFGLRLIDLTRADREALWQRISRQPGGRLPAAARASRAE
jgi:N-hydroxyarylamine O-acetyltransferase